MSTMFIFLKHHNIMTAVWCHRYLRTLSCISCAIQTFFSPALYFILTDPYLSLF